MKRLSKEKRDLIIVTCLGTLAVLFLIIFLLILPQYRAIAQVKSDTDAARNKLQAMENVIKRADTVSNELQNLVYTVTQAESDMAAGDLNAWIYDTIRNFKSHYNIDISVNGQSSTGDMFDHSNEFQRSGKGQCASVPRARRETLPLRIDAGVSDGETRFRMIAAPVS